MALRPPRRILCDEEGRPLRLNEKVVEGVAAQASLARLGRRWNAGFAAQFFQCRSLLGNGMERGHLSISEERNFAKQNIEGHDVSPASVDFEGDGVPDFLGGAEDGRLYYMRHPPTNQR